MNNMEVCEHEDLRSNLQDLQELDAVENICNSRALTRR